MLEILTEEAHFLAVNKPAGLFTQAAAGIDSLQMLLVDQLKRRDNHSGKPFVGLPHRLDRGTSGVVLIARNQRALKRFGAQFQSRKVNKFYLAIVRDEIGDGIFEWNDWIRKVPNEPRAEVVSEGEEGAKLAQLRIKQLSPINQAEPAALCLIQLLTGRMHQIRIQAATRGHCVLGDEIYSGTPGAHAVEVGESSRSQWKRESPLALHALRLEFRHPQTAKPVTSTAPIPGNWADFVGSEALLEQLWGNVLEATDIYDF